MKQGTWMRRVGPLTAFILAFVLAACAPTPSAGDIAVTSEPEGARIFLNGEDTGETTPAVLAKVKTGGHTVAVALGDEMSEGQAVTVQRNKTSSVHFTLTVPPDPDSAVVTGRVLRNRGGSPLAGATVRALTADGGEPAAETVSDEDGFYSLHLPEGTYDIYADAPNRAQARRQHLRLEARQHVVSVDLIAKEILMPGRAATAPTLQIMVQDPLQDFDPTIPFEAGTVVDGLTWVSVFVDSVHPVDIIYAWVGSRHHQPDFADYDTDETEIFLWNFFDAPGDNELRVAAYDVQGNWTEIVVPFVYAVDEPGLPPEEVHGVDLIAFTYGADLGLYRAQRREAFERFGVLDDPDMFDLGDGTLIDLSSLRDDVTMYTVVRWDEVEGAWGYEIERAFTEHGPWERIAALGDWFAQPYMDFGAALQPGKRTYYRVRAIGPNGERGRASVPVWVEPFGRYDVFLVDPADDATDVSLNPTFRWNHTDVGADLYLFNMFVAAATGDPGGALHDYYTWYVDDLENVTEIEYGDGGEFFVDLKPAKTYVWNIDESRAIKFFRPNSAAVAIAGADNGSKNGEYSFTTVTERTASSVD